MPVENALSFTRDSGCLTGGKYGQLRMKIQLHHLPSFENTILAVAFGRTGKS